MSQPSGELIVRFNDSGPQASDRYVKGLSGWEFVASGLWSESPDHEGSATYEVASSADRSIWALRVRNSGRRNQVAAVLVGVTDASDEDGLVRRLLNAAERSGEWYCLEEYARLGRFQL